VRVNVPAQVPDGTDIKNTAKLSADGRPTISSNADSVKVMYRYDLEMRLSVDKTRSPAGSNLLYTYRFTNTTQMPITLTGIVAYAYLEPGLPTLVTPYVLNCVSPCTGWSFVELDPSGNQIYSAALPPLGPNRSTTVTLAARISSTLPANVLAVANYSDASNEQSGEGLEINGLNQSGEKITTVNGPDVIVKQILAPTQGTVKKNLNVKVVLTNNGFVPTSGPNSTGWFGIDLYVRPYGAPPPSGPADRYLGACPNTANPCNDAVRFNTQYQAYGYDPANSLAVDQVITMTFPLTIAPAYPITASQPVRYWLYAQADTFWNENPAIYGTAAHGRIVEGNEVNNIVGPIEIVIDYGKIYLPIIRR
jgi:hypothetical protein